jgi:N utilization substance protein B
MRVSASKHPIALNGTKLVEERMTDHPTDFTEIVPEGGEDQNPPIMDERSISRRIALQALYEIDLAVGEVLTIHLETQKPSRKVARYVEELVQGVVRSRPVLDEAIEQYAPEFPLEQLAIIDRNILRIAIYEFGVRARTPVGVAIDEAVELAKMFGADGASSFINGVLGAVADNHEWLQQIREVSEDGDENSTGTPA